MLVSDYRPAHIDTELWDELPAYIRLKFQQRAQRQEWMAQWAIRVLFLPPLMYIALPPVQGLLPQPVRLVQMVGEEDALRSLDTSELQKGDSVADTSFVITSGYGDRVHPIRGGIEPHYGVDVDTSVGTPLYAPAVGKDTVEVSCWWDSAGGGNVAEITSASVPAYRFKALHLNTCKGGSFKSGEVFAETGATGDGTGPHLDFRQLPIDSGTTVPPQAGYLRWLLTGKIGTQASQTLRESIKEQEGFSAKAYRDPGAGIPTIGFGITNYPDGSTVEMGDVITEEDAEKLLDWHINQASGSVDKLVTTKLNKNEKEALTDLTYNIGAEQLRTSSLLRCLNAGDKACAADEFLEWDKAEDVVLPGLVKRRKQNRALFLKEEE
ncbi:MAG: glycoside hydrolase family protein [Cyanobacteria bacterium P01_H01_bin.21]